jgi:hypothetical protein
MVPLNFTSAGAAAATAGIKTSAKIEAVIATFMINPCL